MYPRPFPRRPAKEGVRGEVLAEAAQATEVAAEADSAGNRPSPHRIMSFGGHGFFHGPRTILTSVVPPAVSFSGVSSAPSRPGGFRARRYRPSPLAAFPSRQALPAVWPLQAVPSSAAFPSRQAPPAVWPLQAVPSAAAFPSRQALPAVWPLQAVPSSAAFPSRQAPPAVWPLQAVPSVSAFPSRQALPAAWPFQAVSSP